ncbi:hypothetical protein J3R83DRAFT_13596 [Lanmaoa asiatica]|nr:hypothetical protein J3R83DRAFT_13596 [Lanmaoa asiatica]
MSTSQGHHASPTPDPGDGRQQRVLCQFHSFPFSSDEAFRQGLSGIFAHESMNQMPDNERSELILKTKVFYFNRVTGHNISLEDAQAGSTADLNHFPAQSGNEYGQTSGAEHREIRVLTFAELKSLIEQGKTGNIPNNKIIPDTLNDGIPSESIAQSRRKPWEVASQT